MMYNYDADIEALACFRYLIDLIYYLINCTTQRFLVLRKRKISRLRTAQLKIIGEMSLDHNSTYHWCLHRLAYWCLHRLAYCVV